MRKFAEEFSTEIFTENALAEDLRITAIGSQGAVAEGHSETFRKLGPRRIKK
jgi:hypothetical protein